MTTATANPFRQRGTITVTIQDVPNQGDEIVSTYPFPSMLLTEAYEWERRSGKTQRDFWGDVSKGDVVALQMLLWQALRRQPGQQPEVDGRSPGPWSMLRWEETPDVDLFRMTYSIEGFETEEIEGDDPNLPTISGGEGSTSD